MYLQYTKIKRFEFNICQELSVRQWQPHALAEVETIVSKKGRRVTLLCLVALFRDIEQYCHYSEQDYHSSRLHEANSYTSSRCSWQRSTGLIWISMNKNMKKQAWLVICTERTSFWRIKFCLWHRSEFCRCTSVVSHGNTSRSWINARTSKKSEQDRYLDGYSYSPCEKYFEKYGYRSRTWNRSLVSTIHLSSQKSVTSTYWRHGRRI